MIWYITRRKEMGLFNKLNRNKEEKNMDNAFVATPHFYANADKRVFGAIALTEEIVLFFHLILKKNIKLMEKKLMSGRWY